jgi:hypothetical protein
VVFFLPQRRPPVALSPSALRPRQAAAPMRQPHLLGYKEAHDIRKAIKNGETPKTPKFRHPSDR